MRKKILVAAEDFGGANSIIPTFRELSRDYEIIGINKGKLPFKLREKGLNINLHSSPSVSTQDMIEAINYIQPSLILTGTSCQTPTIRDVVDQTLVLATKTKKKPSISTYDLWCSWEERVGNLYDENGVYHSEVQERFAFLPTIIAIPDITAFKAMIKLGFPRSKLAVTGNPAFDKYARLDKDFPKYERRAIKKSLTGSLEKELITWVSQPVQSVLGDSWGFNEKDALRCFLGGLKKDRYVLIKASRQRENLDELRKIASEYPNVNAVVDNSEYSIDSVVLASDIVATINSTSFVPAICAGIPVISVQPNVSEETTKKLATYYFKDRIPVARKASRVESRILKAQKSSENAPYTLDGNATREVCKLARRYLDQ